MRISRWILGPALTLSLLALPAVAADASPKAADHDFKATPMSVKLAKPLHGKAALKALDGQLDVAAKLNRTSIKKLHDVLDTDPEAWISTSGRLFYTERFNRPTPAARMSNSTSSIPPATKPLASTFQLHSIPAHSAHTVYLDFTGYTLGAGSWVSAGYTKGTYKGFSLDSDYTTFSDAERAYIQHVWQVVSEKYSVFDIDVTTQDPGTGAYNRSGSGDLTYGDHVVFSDVTSGSGAKPTSICPAGCDGISFTGSFDDPTDNVNDAEPTWIYTHDWKGYSGMAGEIAAHEIGHTLGLHHDGLGTGDGDYGSGNDAYYQGGDLWSPVMGAGVGALTQFSKGEYASASNTEDDFAVMQTFGVNLKTDDWGDLATPTDLGIQPTYKKDGILGDAADTDAFLVSHTCASTLRATATGIGAGQTLDLAVTLRNPADDSILATGGNVTTANTSTYPRVARDADATATLDSAPTSVLVEVSGVGQSDPATDVDGYSTYGSVGRYHLTVNGCSSVDGATPDAPNNVTATQPSRTGTLTLNWAQPVNAGDSAVTAYRITGVPAGPIDVSANDRSESFTGLIPGTTYDITIAAVNQYGAGPAVAISKTLSTWAPTTVAPKVTTSAYGTTVAVRWTEPANPGRAPAKQWITRLYDSKGVFLQEFPVDYGYPGLKITGVGNNDYQVRTWLTYYTGGTRTLMATTKVSVGPSAPRIGTPSSGATGGAVNATVRWLAPYTLRGQKITSYTVGAYKLDAHNHIVKLYVSSPRSATARSYVWALPKGRYKFRVQAHATGGYTALSAYSTIATSK